MRMISISFRKVFFWSMCWYAQKIESTQMAKKGFKKEMIFLRLICKIFGQRNKFLWKFY